MSCRIYIDKNHQAHVVHNGTVLPDRMHLPDRLGDLCITTPKGKLWLETRRGAR